MVIVDDGSADGTKRVAFDFVRKYTVDNVRVILLGRNHGKGEAIRKVSLIRTISCGHVLMLLKVPVFFIPFVWQQLIEALYLCESIVKQGMLHSRGELLLMLDADGATKVDDLEKLENQVCIIHHFILEKTFFFWIRFYTRETWTSGFYHP